MAGQELAGSCGRYSREFLEKDKKRLNYRKLFHCLRSYLAEERVRSEEEPPRQGDFDGFLNSVLSRAELLLGGLGVKILYAFPNRRMGFKESWKCIRVFENQNIYYRIGRTRPRKRVPQGENLLFIDLVMDGQKRQVFLPLLNLKEKIEKELGEVIERELPSVEKTGKYRFKLFMPFDVVERQEIAYVSLTLARFILITKNSLNKLGIS